MKEINKLEKSQPAKNPKKASVKKKVAPKPYSLKRGKTKSVFDMHPSSKVKTTNFSGIGERLCE